MSSNSAGPALSQGVGYGIVLGVGLAFAAAMVSREPHCSSAKETLADVLE
jgi:hypothetical protein